LATVDMFYIVLIMAYLIAVIWYIWSIINARKQKEVHKHTAHRRKRSRHREGKRCPQCQKVIDRRRSVCQHCGQVFQLAPGVEPHPDEVKKGIVKPLSAEPKA
jgi:hypothetical protein